MVKKGQAAMEFLMTYGWAILVVLIAIGALAYFGVLNPSRFLPESCTLVPGLGCDDFAVTAATDTVDIIVRNGMGDSIDAAGLYLDVDSSGAFEVANDCECAAGALCDPAALADGATATWTFVGCPDIVAGTSFRADLRGTYTKGSSTLTHQLSGTIAARG